MRATNPTPGWPFKNPIERILHGFDPRVQISIREYDPGIWIHLEEFVRKVDTRRIRGSLRSSQHWISASERVNEWKNSHCISPAICRAENDPYASASCHRACWSKLRANTRDVSQVYCAVSIPRSDTSCSRAFEALCTSLPRRTCQDSPLNY